MSQSPRKATFFADGCSFERLPLRELLQTITDGDDDALWYLLTTKVYVKYRYYDHLFNLLTESLNVPYHKAADDFSDFLIDLFEQLRKNDYRALRSFKGEAKGASADACSSTAAYERTFYSWLVNSTARHLFVRKLQKEKKSSLPPTLEIKEGITADTTEPLQGETACMALLYDLILRLESEEDRLIAMKMIQSDKSESNSREIAVAINDLRRSRQGASYIPATENYINSRRHKLRARLARMLSEEEALLEADL